MTRKYFIIADIRYQIDKVYPKRRYSIKQSRRRRKRIGQGYKSGAYSFVTEAYCTSKVERCKLCRGDDDSGVLSSVKKVSSMNAFDWINCDVCQWRRAWKISGGGHRQWRIQESLVGGDINPAGGLGGAVSPPVGSRGEAPGHQTKCNFMYILLYSH